MFNRKGEVSTILILGTLVVIGVAALFSSTVTKQKNTTNAQAAEGCPITNVEISGKTCKVTINFTPGDPTPAAPRNLVCALVNPARDTNTANNQLVAGQGANVGLDFFNRTSTGQFPLKPEPDFTAKLQPVPSDGNYNLVAYDFTNPGGCLKEIKVSAATAQAVGDSSSQTPVSTATPVPPAGNPTNPPQNQNPTTSPNNNQTPQNTTNTPTPKKACSGNLVKCPDSNLCVSALVECPVSPTPAKTCTGNLVKCPNANLCVPALVECPGTTYTPTPTQTRVQITLGVPPNSTPTPTSQQTGNALPIPPIPTIQPAMQPKVESKKTVIRLPNDIEGKVCVGDWSSADWGCIDIYGFYIHQL